MILQKLDILGKKMKFFSFRVFWMLGNRVLVCNKFVNLSRMIQSPPFIILYKFSIFWPLFLFLKKGEVTIVICLYWLVYDLIRVGMIFLIQVCEDI